MKAWWEGLSERERLMIAGGGAFVALVILIQFALAPLMAWRSAAAQRADAAEAEFALVHEAAALAPPRNTGVDSGQPIKTVLNAQAGALEVPLTFVNALPDGNVEMQAGPASPKAVFALFSVLESEHGVRIVAADVSRNADAPDTVRVQATLAR